MASILSARPNTTTSTPSPSSTTTASSEVTTGGNVANNNLQNNSNGVQPPLPSNPLLMSTTTTTTQQQQDTSNGNSNGSPSITDTDLTSTTDQQFNGNGQLDNRQPLPQAITQTTGTRCVIIQKDEKGFGLRVSGDNPVFVESVRPDGAAYRSGVRAGDRIIKVNGTLVTKHGHQEVVRLIQAGGSAYVSLHLLGPPPPLPVDPEPQQMGPPLPAANAPASMTTVIPTLPPTQTQHIITAPLPASSSTMLEFDRTKEKTLKAMIKRENNYLKVNTTSMSADEMRAAQERVAKLKQNLHFLKRTRTRQHLNSASSHSKKSHSFNEQLTTSMTQPILCMESDEEDDEADQSDRDEQEEATSLNSIEDVLRTGRRGFCALVAFAFEQQFELAPLLFLLLEKQYREEEVPRKDWLFELHSVFLLPDSPLRLDNFNESELNKVYDALNSLSSTPSPRLLDMFVTTAHHQLTTQLLGQWNKQLQLGLLPLLPATPHNVHHLLNGCFTGTETQLSYFAASEPVAGTLGSLIQGQFLRKESELMVLNRGLARCLALISVLVVHFPSLLPKDQVIQAQLQQYLLLNKMVVSGSGQVKRHKSLPSSSSVQAVSSHLVAGCSSPGGQGANKSWSQESSPFLSALLSPTSSTPPSLPLTSSHKSGHGHKGSASSVLARQGHSFSSPSLFPALSSVVYCNACGHLLWGRPLLSLQCGQCFILNHSWCYFKSEHSAGNMPCPFKSGSNSSSSNLLGGSGSGSGVPVVALQHKKHNRVTSFVDNLLKQNKSSHSSGHGVADAALKDMSNFVQLPAQSSSSSSCSSSTSSRCSSPSLSSKSPTTTATTTGSGHSRTTSPSGGYVSASSEPEVERKERKRKVSRQRRDVLRELLRTEKSHVHNLQLLDILFYKPSQQEGLLSPDELVILFVNHKLLKELHTEIYDQLKTIIRPVLKRGSSLGGGGLVTSATTTPTSASGATTTSTIPTYKQLCSDLCDLFSGPLGQQLAKEAAAFCCKQGQAHELLRLKQQKSYKFLSFLSEAEHHPALKRLRFKDLLAACFQRVTKYPLLLQSLLKTFSGDERTDERLLVEEALNSSRAILSVVNAKVREEEGRVKLGQLQKRAQIQHDPLPPALMSSDWSTSLELVHEGHLSWRITKQKMIEVQAVLTTSYLLVLTKEASSSSSSQQQANSGGGGGMGAASDSDSVRLVLRGHLNPINKSTYTPVLSVKRLLTRNVATDKTAFFIVQPDEHSIYEFVASSAAERKAWTEAIQRLVVTIEQAGQLTISPDSSSGSTSTPVTTVAELQVPLPGAAVARPRSIRVEGSISLVSREEEESQRLVDFSSVRVRDSQLTSSQCRCEEAISVLSPQERLKRLEQQIVDAVGQRSVLLKRNRDESELDSSEDVCDDLLALVCRLQLGQRSGGDDDLGDGVNDSSDLKVRREELKQKIRSRLDQF